MSLEVEQSHPSNPAFGTHSTQNEPQLNLAPISNSAGQNSFRNAPAFAPLNPLNSLNQGQNPLASPPSYQSSAPNLDNTTRGRNISRFRIKFKSPFKKQQSKTPGGSTWSLDRNLSSQMASTLNVSGPGLTEPLKLSRKPIKQAIAQKLGPKYTKLFDHLFSIEEIYAKLHASFTNYQVQTAAIRNSGDDVALLFALLSRMSCHTFKQSLDETAKHVGIVQDYRNAQADRIQKKIVDVLSGYGPKVKSLKNDAKRLQTAIMDEQKAKAVYSKKVASAKSQIDIEKARVAHQVKLGTLEQQKKVFDTSMAEFEKQRLEQLKQLLKDFVQIEMLFHAKVLDFYSGCWKNLEDIQPEVDFTEFKQLYLEAGLDTSSLGATSTSLGTKTNTSLGLGSTYGIGATTRSANASLGGTAPTIGLSATAGTPGLSVSQQGQGQGQQVQGQQGQGRSYTGYADDEDYDDEDDDDEDEDEIEVETLDEPSTLNTSSNIQNIPPPRPTSGPMTAGQRRN